MPEKRPHLHILEGACSTGKSSLFDLYDEEAHPDIYLVPETARLFYQTHDIPHGERQTLETQMRIQKASVTSIANAMAEANKIVFADASPVAAAAYAALKSQETAEKLYANIENWLCIVHRFYLLSPHDVQYIYNPNDPIRQETPEERMQAHENLAYYLERSGIQVVQISGDIQSRKAQIDLLLFS